MTDPTVAERIVEKMHALVQVCPHRNPADAQTAMREASFAAQRAITEITTALTEAEARVWEKAAREMERAGTELDGNDVTTHILHKMCNDICATFRRCASRRAGR